MDVWLEPPWIEMVYLWILVPCSLGWAGWGYQQGKVGAKEPMYGSAQLMWNGWWRRPTYETSFIPVGALVKRETEQQVQASVAEALRTVQDYITRAHSYATDLAQHEKLEEIKTQAQ